MPANYEQPEYVQRRVRYFDGQFLKDQDFIDDQKYHIDRQRRTNQLLHVSGICSGLTIKVDNDQKTYTVEPGTALDAQGRFLILSEAQSAAIDIATGNLDVFIAYQEQEADVTQPDNDKTNQGVAGATRWLETPQIAAVEPKKVPPDSLLLARLEIKSTGITVDNSVRQYSGVALPSSNGNPPILRSQGNQAPSWAELQGSFTISDNLVVDGKVAIGTTNSSAPLKIRATGNTSPGSNGLHVHNPNNSANQHAIITASVGGSNAGNPFISWDVANEAGWSMGIDNQDSNKLKIARTWDNLAANTALTIDRNGNVGVGKTNPSQKLEVNGNAILNNAFLGDIGYGADWAGFSHKNSTGQGNYALLQNDAGTETLINTKTGGTIRLRVNNADKVVMDGDGNLGVGLTTPSANLDVTGIQGTGGQISLQLRSGNAAANFASNQIAFGHNNTTRNRHAIKTRHHSSRRSGNAIDFYVWKYLNNNDKDGEQDIGSLHTMTLDGGYVGIRTTSPSAPLEVRATSNTSITENGLLVYNASNNANQHAIIAARVAGKNGGNPFVSWSIAGEAGWSMGIDNSDDNKLKIASVGNDLTDKTALTIDRSNNMGIGITTPTANLDVKGVSGTVGQISLQLRSGNVSNNFNSNQISLGYANTDQYRHVIKTRHNGGGRSGNAIDFYVWKYLSNNDKDTPGDIGSLHTMTLDGSYVGIGTTSPSAPLEVRANSNTSPANNGLYVYNADNSANQHAILSARVAGSSGGNPFVSWDIANEAGWCMGMDNSDSNKLKIARAWNSLTNNTALTIDRNGKVGIGTTSPSRKLEVNGNAILNNVFNGNVGHSSTWAGFCHKDSVGTGSYALLQNNAGTETLINTKTGGNIRFRINNSDQMIMTSDGVFHAKVWNSGEYIWGQGQRPVRMAPTSHAVCFLTGVQGQFEGGGEWVRVYASGGYWYLGGGSAQRDVQARAICIGYSY